MVSCHKIHLTMRLALFTLLLLLTTSCHTQRRTFSVSFGSGGGVTGNAVMYSLSSDGKITKTSTFTKVATPITTLSKKEMGKIILLATTAKLDTLKINNPSNMSNYLDLQIDSIMSHQIWSGTSSGNASLDSLFNLLNAFVKSK